MNVTRTSHVRIAGRWVRVPNWVIRERKPWSTEKKNRERDRAVRIGELQTFVSNSPLAPTVGLVTFVGFIGVAGNLIESIKL